MAKSRKGQKKIANGVRKISGIKAHSNKGLGKITPKNM